MPYFITNEDNTLFYNLRNQTTTTDIKQAQIYPIANQAFLKTMSKFLANKYNWEYKECNIVSILSSDNSTTLSIDIKDLNAQNTGKPNDIDDEDEEIITLFDADEDSLSIKANNAINEDDKSIISSNVSMLTSLLKETATSSTSLNSEEFIKAVNGIIDNYNHLISHEKSLSKELSIIDKKLIDLTHYIEFTELNACEGYKAYKLMHEITKQRREVKNELATIQSLTAHIPVQKVSSFNRYITKQSNKHYTPRILTELFI